MADPSRTPRPSFALRRGFIDQADRILVDAKAVAARAEDEQTEVFLWNEAGDAFEQAAKLYRRADLGLLARDIFAQASYSFGRSGASDDARRCDRFSREIQPYWEASPNE